MEKLTFMVLVLLMINTITTTSTLNPYHHENECSFTQCSESGPGIHFPFRLEHQPEFCGYPGFNLFCRHDTTYIELPFSGEFVVRYIDYLSQMLYVSDTNNYCLPQRIIHLNLSSSPFDCYSFKYEFYNCTKPLPDEYYSLVSCLSGPGYYVYSGTASVSSLEVLSSSSCRSILSTRNSCRSIPTKPFFPIFVVDLQLGWTLPRCKDCYGACGFNKTINQTFCMDNPIYYNPPTSTKPIVIIKVLDATTKKNNVIIGTSLGIFGVMVVVIGIIYIYKRSKTEKNKEEQIKVEKFLAQYKSLKPTRYSYSDVKKMTSHFKHMLGQGGYGNVFKGKLTTGVLVAVKILENSKGDGEDFINEVATIGHIHHVNVVRLLGYCVDGLKRALIYEFMPNESLEKFIFESSDKSPLLDWKRLQDIAIGIARGVEYLHQGCDQRILHLDIKPHNVLLDENFVPKISDFGLAKLCSKEQSIVSITGARGTMGYIAPEVFSKNFGTVSHKSDVYSFGMMLMEMVGGKKSTDNAEVENDGQFYFPEWAYHRLERGEDLSVTMADDDEVEIVKKLTVVALWCIQWDLSDRPPMKKVVQMLEGGVESLFLPPNPFNSCFQV